MAKEPYITMPEFARRTQRPVHEVKKLVLSGELRAIPRFANRDQLTDPLCVPMIAVSDVEAYHVDHEPDTSTDPGARRQATFAQASAKRQLQVHEEIDAGDPRVRHARAMQKWQEHNRSALEALNEMSEAAKGLGDSQ
jgi:hypothetical protein